MRVVKQLVPGLSCECKPKRISKSAPPESSDATEIVIDYDRLADALLERMSEDERFRGPVGVPGLPGPQGPPGEVPDIDELRSEIHALKLLRRKVVLVKDGKIVDSEEYRWDEPIVLDAKKIQKAGE